MFKKNYAASLQFAWGKKEEKENIWNKPPSDHKHLGLYTFSSQGLEIICFLCLT